MMKNKKQVLNAVLSVAVLVCLLALMNSISKPVFGIPATVVVLSFVAVKAKEFITWTKNKSK